MADYPVGKSVYAPTPEDNALLHQTLALLLKHTVGEGESVLIPRSVEVGMNDTVTIEPTDDGRYLRVGLRAGASKSILIPV